MAMYAIGILPLIHKLQGSVTQVWYADDASARGKTSDLRVWWDSLVSCGPHFGYNPNPCKTWLVVKPEHLPAAEEHFQGSGVNITTQGHRHLGAPLGSKSFVEEFIRASHGNYNYSFKPAPIILSLFSNSILCSFSQILE